MRMHGLLTVKDFANLETAAAEVRVMLKELFTVADDAALIDKLQISRVVGAWETARRRHTQAEQVAAVAKAHGQSMQMANSAYLSLLASFHEAIESMILMRNQ